jgi:hypothetical protein
MVKRMLRKYKYPPDMEASALELVLQQAQALGESWTREHTDSNQGSHHSIIRTPRLKRYKKQSCLRLSPLRWRLFWLKLMNKQVR